MTPADRPRTVLVVDDDDAIRDVTALALEAVSGFHVVTASGGAEALEQARRHRPDAVLLDVMMPEMDGPTTLRHMREDPDLRDIPVVLLTAKVQVAAEGTAGPAGATGTSWRALDVAGVIAKPFDPMLLGGQLGAFLDW